MAKNDWTPLDMYPEGSAVWLMLVCNTAIQAMRTSGLPSESASGRMRVSVPSLLNQARAMRGNDVTIGPTLMQERIDEAKFLLELIDAFDMSGLPFEIPGTTTYEETQQAINNAKRISAMAATTNAYYHVHKNKDVLDKFSQLDSGKPAYNNRELLTEMSANYDVATIMHGEDVPDNLREGGLIIETPAV